MPRSTLEGTFVLQEPSTTRLQTQATWKRIRQDAAAAAAASCPPAYMLPVATSGSYGPIGEARYNNAGGWNADGWNAPFYDPRNGTTRVLHTPVPGELMYGVATLPKAAAPFYPDVGPAEPKTQYAPVGKIPFEKETIDLPTHGCVCACQPLCYTIEQALLEPLNVWHMRNQLEQSGVIAVTDRLKAVGDRACACALLGGGPLYQGFVTYAANFGIDSAGVVPDLAATLYALNTQFVEQTLGQVRSQVLDAARINYARAEGAAVAIVPYPVPEGSIEVKPPQLPPHMPYSGATTTPLDTPFAAYQLNNPIASAKRKAAFRQCTGLPVGLNTVTAVYDCKLNTCGGDGCGPRQNNVCTVSAKPDVVAFVL